MLTCHLDSRLQYTHHDQLLAAISNGFANIGLTRRTNRAVTTIEAGDSAHAHIEDFRSEVRQLTRTMSVPWVRSGIEFDTAHAIDEMVARMSTPKVSQYRQMPGHTELGNTAHQTLIPVITTSASAHVCADGEIDIEKGTDSSVIRGLGSRSLARRKRLISNDMVVKRTLFGTIYIHSKKSILESSQHASAIRGSQGTREEFESTYGFRPADWLLAWNLNLGGEFILRRSSQGWKNSIRTFRAVGDDHDMFRFCREGNIDGVRTLLSRGDASPWDINTHGWTPLHVSILHPQPAPLASLTFRRSQLTNVILISANYFWRPVRTRML
jgi:hypothetical protein